MNVLVVGSGGREHALGWKLKLSSRVKKIYFAPGNGGTSLLGENLPHSRTDDIADWASRNNIGLVVVGPDNYLAEGLVDELQKKNIPVFGPTQAASEIEWSKSFAKELMRREKIPTARFEVFASYEKALEYVKKEKFPLVIKASGLASGKGVVIAQDAKESEQILKKMMEDGIHGPAGREVVIEEFLSGMEISVHAFCDGENAVLFPASQDHKRAFDGDIGPNTGGMGTIAPVPVGQDELDEIKKKIILPVLAALKRDGKPFKGILFPGIMLTDDGPKVLEFNARFGDPETQSYMRILKTDLVDIMEACIKGDLQELDIRWENSFACCVILASAGYPGSYQKGFEISGLNSAELKDAVIFHAGTLFKNGKFETNGGRVLGVSATGGTLADSLSKAYASVELIRFEGAYSRRDIGAKWLNGSSVLPG